jgi:hypothetical protein
VKSVETAHPHEVSRYLVPQWGERNKKVSTLMPTRLRINGTDYDTTLVNNSSQSITLNMETSGDAAFVAATSPSDAPGVVSLENGDVAVHLPGTNQGARRVLFRKVG